MELGAGRVANLRRLRAATPTELGGISQYPTLDDMWV